MKEILFAFLKNQKAAALFKFFKVYKGVVIISEVNDVKSMNVNTVMLSEFDWKSKNYIKLLIFIGDIILSLVCFQNLQYNVLNIKL